MSRYDDASDEAQALLENHDDIDLAELLASSQRDLASTRAALTSTAKDRDRAQIVVGTVSALAEEWFRAVQAGQRGTLWKRAAQELRSTLDNVIAGTGQGIRMPSSEGDSIAGPLMRAPATGGTIDTASFRQVGEGPVCDGNLLPRREPGAARAAVTLDHPAPDAPTLAAIVQALTEQTKQQRGPGQ